MVAITTHWNRPCRSLSGAASLLVAVRLRPEAPEPSPSVHALVLLDVSTSMAEGGRMAAAKDAVRTAWHQLRPGDRMALVTFGSLVRPRLEWTTRGTVDDAVIDAALAEIEVSGTTCLDAGLAYGFHLLADCPAGSPRHLWLVTDGNPTNPNGRARTDYLPFLEEASRAADAGVSLCALGLGEAENYNAPFLRDLADRGRGQFCYAPQPSGLAAHLGDLLGRARATGLTETRLELTLEPGNSLSAIARILPDYLPMDLPSGDGRWQVTLGPAHQPETVILIELTNVALFGTKAGEQQIGRITVTGRQGATEVRCGPLPLMLTFAAPGDHRIHEVDPVTDDLRVALEIARNTEMRARSDTLAEKLAITSKLVDLSRRTSDLALISTYEAELAQLMAERGLTADQETQTVAQARATSRLLGMPE